MLDFKQFCALLLWIHLLTFVQCEKGCTLQEFKQSSLFNENFDTSNLASSYNVAEFVRVPCQVGYTGYFRLLCTDRGWTGYGDGCRRILCGHPGDVQFADFILVVGTDYDFGSKVEYTCHKGYQMTSNISTRNCLQGGWDGHLPECKPMTCKLSTDCSEGTAYDFRPGDTMTVSCGEKLWVKSTELLSAVITCQDRGEWDFEPVCKPVTCFKLAEHVHGWSWTNILTAKMDETWSYRCHQGFVETSPTATATCTRRGWEPYPLCKEP